MFSHSKTVENENMSSSPDLNSNKVGYESEKNLRNSDNQQCFCINNKLKKNRLVSKVVEIKYTSKSNTYTH